MKQHLWLDKFNIDHQKYVILQNRQAYFDPGITFISLWSEIVCSSTVYDTEYSIHTQAMTSLVSLNFSLYAGYPDHMIIILYLQHILATTYFFALKSKFNPDFK
jgi:hypothetical protein